MLKNNNGGKNLDFRLESLPATTRLVPMKESMMIECRIPESAMVREANRHNNVAKPSTIAPKNTLTCQIMANISNYCHFLLSEYFINYYYYLYLQVRRTVFERTSFICLSKFKPPKNLYKTIYTTATHQLSPGFQYHRSD